MLAVDLGPTHRDLQSLSLSCARVCCETALEAFSSRVQVFFYSREAPGEQDAARATLAVLTQSIGLLHFGMSVSERQQPAAEISR